MAADGQSPFTDTIFALSSGGLPAGVAVIRLSGPHVRGALGMVAGGLPPARQATLRALRDGNGDVLDRGLVLFFPGPASFTGEDCAELQVHGGRAVVTALLATLGAVEGLRSAEAGEFTRRAFINGRIDLTGAEALADLIAADTEAQRRLALANAEGGQRELYAGWRKELVYARAQLEAGLDFSDEADIPDAVPAKVWARLKELAEAIDRHLAGYHAAEIVRDGFRVVLVGAPNAGKSSLLNALARREAAIVTDIAGTTRDLVEVALDLNGMKVLVIDTAGLRDTDDKIERIGVERAVAAAENADLVLELIDPSGEAPDLPGPRRPDRTIRVATKIDLQPPEDAFDYAISVISGKGLPALVDMITQRANAALARAGATIPTRLRHVELLRQTRDHIKSAERSQGLELQAEYLRMASDSLGRITGAVEVEELLGVIFSEFCIGK